MRAQREGPTPRPGPYPQAAEEGGGHMMLLPTHPPNLPPTQPPTPPPIHPPTHLSARPHALPIGCSLAGTSCCRSALLPWSGGPPPPPPSPLSLLHEHAHAKWAQARHAPAGSRRAAWPACASRGAHHGSSAAPVGVDAAGCSAHVPVPRQCAHPPDSAMPNQAQPSPTKPKQAQTGPTSSTRLD
jgi:hypothetical protein